MVALNLRYMPEMVEQILVADRVGVFPLFGFAVADYRSLKKIDYKDITDGYVCGVVIDNSDTSDTINSFITLCDIAKIEMIIFGWCDDVDSNRSYDIIMNNEILNHNYTEFKDVYETRRVFVRKHDDEKGHE